MTLIDNQPGATTAGAPTRRDGHWIDDWRPEDPEFWETGGKPVARRNLIWSIFAEHLGFSVWLLWSVIAAFLLPDGLRLHRRSSSSCWSRCPTWSASLLRLPYTFAVPQLRRPQLDDGQRRCCC